MTTNYYKIKHLKVFGSSENLYQNFKKYRQVYDESEARYIYAELAFYNKKFDEIDWTCQIRLVCTQADTRQKICELEKSIEVKAEQNISYVREGWGTPNPGWWKKGHYRWDAYLDGQLVFSTSFYITGAGLITPSHNPYFKIRRVRFFESDSQGLSIEKRQYLRIFGANTRYINVEILLDLQLKDQALPLEFQLNFYNEIGQHKAYIEYFTHITDQRPSLSFDLGYGSDNGNYWFKGNYTLDILFMDQLIAVVPFEVADQAQELLGEMPFRTSRGIALAHMQEVGLETEDDQAPSFEQATQELLSLIGLETVKKQIQELATYLQFINFRREKGFKEDQAINLHTVFIGNPGTGKTTVAKLLGKIYRSLGLLSKGNVHEVGRVDLVGEFIGQTAPKVQKAIEKARGGILFVDEAYALSDRGDDNKDFGKEVMEVLIKEMSDGKGDLAVVFAGYPKEMQTFLHRNPGMQSRIQSLIHFPDYVPDELMQIANFAADKRDIHFDEPSLQYLQRKITEAYRNRDERFGNARFVNGVVEECKQNMALRLMALGQTELERLETIALSQVTLPDVEKAFGQTNRNEIHIPIDLPLLNEALAELHELSGLEAVKRDVEEMAKLVRYYTDIGRNVRRAFSLHTVFTGNPGTGKTTVARIITKIYKALGVLERGHLVETDRKGLVAGYVGQTASKTDALIESAMGGCLFIDEAYALSEGSQENTFGREAIDTLLKRMEDKRGEFMVIVAGYPKEMKRFLESNPGLLSRFDRTLHFADYTEDELLEIFQDMLAREDLYLDQQAKIAAQNYIQELLANKHRYFGNARTIRKFVKELARKQHLRLAALSPQERKPEMVKTVLASDIEGMQLVEKQEAGQVGIGFGRSRDN